MNKSVLQSVAFFTLSFSHRTSNIFANAPQKYAGHVHEFKEDAGLSEVSIGYIVAGDLAASPKSPAYSLLRKGALEEKDVKKLKKGVKVRAHSAD